MPSSDLARRAVITGLGAVMPIGNDFETYWTNLQQGVTGTRPIRTFDASEFEVRIAAEVVDFDPGAVMDAKMARRMSRFIHLAMGAGKEAVRSSGIDFAGMTEEQRDRVGVVVNTGGGGIEAIIDGTHVHDMKGPRFVSAFAVPALSGSMAGCMLSMEYRLTGPVMTQVAACATSVIAFHDALRLIATGEADVVLAGGSEAPIVPMGVAALSNMTALSKNNEHPETASRPFDLTRDGFVLGEGAGVMVIESAEHALERGATPLAEVLGGALTADAFHISAPDPTGRGQSRAMTTALRNSGVAPDEVDWIVAHGTSTSLNDVTETRAIKTAYGSAAATRAISSPKSMIGHLVGAAGIASALAAVGGIRDDVISPTANLRTPDPECDLDYVPLVARQAKVDTVAVNGFGFGGQNAVTIFRRFAVDG
ncbi:MAG TPA: beta-ketoacyl-ACP synthase II [Candidatus Limnocylindrales bacterium]|nr:beta-ketoacyl-ACP synthase II [Candidatus Limnocylindrales bacterium]